MDDNYYYNLIISLFLSSYALLTVMIAHITGLKPGDFIHTLGRRLIVIRSNWCSECANNMLKMDPLLNCNFF